MKEHDDVLTRRDKQANSIDDPPQPPAGDTSALNAACADCGVPLNEGEAKCFTVCDACWRKVYPTSAQTTGNVKLDRYVDKVAELEALAKGLTEKDYARNTSDDRGRGALSGPVPVGRASGREGTDAAVPEASVAATERTRSPFPAEILSSERSTSDGPRDTASSSSSSSALTTLRASLITLRDQWRTKAGYMQTGSACWAVKSCVDELDALIRDTPPEEA